MLHGSDTLSRDEGMRKREGEISYTHMYTENCNVFYYDEFAF